MTVLHKSGTISLVKGSFEVNGTDTGWQTALIVAGTIYVNVPNVGALALPIDEVQSNTKIISAIPWEGANGTYTYALARDEGRQSTENAIQLARLLVEMGSETISELAGLDPVADTFPFFGPGGAAALASLPLAARQFLAGEMLPDTQLPKRLAQALTNVTASANEFKSQGWSYFNNTAVGRPFDFADTMIFYQGNASFGWQFGIEVFGSRRARRYNNNGVFASWIMELSSDSSGLIPNSQLPPRLGSVTLNVADTNSISDNGFFGQGNNLNIPYNNEPWFIRSTVWPDPNYRDQEATSLFNRFNNYRRRMIGGAWQGWVHAGAATLGTVSQVGGLPTGSIIERGSNANGQYVRFADGTQICSGNFVGYPANSTVLRPLPAAFFEGVNPCFASVTPFGGLDFSYQFWADDAGAFKFISTNQSATNRVDWCVIGRWY